MWQVIDPEHVFLILCIVDDFWPEVDALRPCCCVECILVLEGPIFEIWTGVDPESVVVSEPTVSEWLVNTRTLLWR